MKEKKRRLFIYSFYDRSGIENALEREAAEGWLLEKTSAFGWVFRKTEPKKVHFTVAYFHKASAYDPEPSEDELLFREFCEHTGWKLISSNAQLQIFCNENEAPLPIETDPVVEVETIHNAAKKTYLSMNLMQIVLGVMQLCLLAYRLSIDPISVFTSNANLFCALAWLSTLALSLLDVGTYYSWLKKARSDAAEGKFRETNGTALIQMLASSAMLIAFALLLLDMESRTLLIAVLLLVMILAAVAISIGFTKLLKKLKFSARLNRNLSLTFTLLLSFLAVGIGTIGIVSYMSTHSPSDAAGTYEYNGMSFEYYKDELPLKIEDMAEADEDKYSYQLKEHSSVLMTELECSQRALLNYSELPKLEYGIMNIKQSTLYSICLKTKLSELGSRYNHRGGNETMPIDEAPELWGADKVYCFDYDGDGSIVRYLICYDKSIVELSAEWTLSEADKAVIGKKLG